MDAGKSAFGQITAVTLGKHGKSSYEPKGVEETQRDKYVADVTAATETIVTTEAELASRGLVEKI